MDVTRSMLLPAWESMRASARARARPERTGPEWADARHAWVQTRAEREHAERVFGAELWPRAAPAGRQASGPARWEGLAESEEQLRAAERVFGVGLGGESERAAVSRSSGAGPCDCAEVEDELMQVGDPCGTDGEVTSARSVAFHEGGCRQYYSCRLYTSMCDCYRVPGSAGFNLCNGATRGGWQDPDVAVTAAYDPDTGMCRLTYPCVDDEGNPAGSVEDSNEHTACAGGEVEDRTSQIEVASCPGWIPGADRFSTLDAVIVGGVLGGGGGLVGGGWVDGPLPIADVIGTVGGALAMAGLFAAGSVIYDEVVDIYRERKRRDCSRNFLSCQSSDLAGLPADDIQDYSRCTTCYRICSAEGRWPDATRTGEDCRWWMYQ